MKDVHSKMSRKCGDCPKTFKIKIPKHHTRNEHNKNHGKESSDESLGAIGGNTLYTDRTFH